MGTLIPGWCQCFRLFGESVLSIRLVQLRYISPWLGRHAPCAAVERESAGRGNCRIAVAIPPTVLTLYTRYRSAYGETLGNRKLATGGGYEIRQRQEGFVALIGWTPWFLQARWGPIA